MSLRRDEITIGNLRISFLEGGRGPTLIFLHGAPISSRNYQMMLDYLSRRFRVIAPDAPGFGKSPPPPEVWSFNDYATVFSKFISLMELDNVYLVGNSFGGGIASVLGGINPKIARIGLFAPAGIPVKRWSRFLASFLFVKTTNGALNYHRFPLLASAFAQITTTILTRPHKVSLMYKTIKHSLLTEYPHQKDIDVPTQIIWFKQDEIFPLKDAAELNQRIRTSTLKIMEGFHDWCYFHPKEHAKLICNFNG